MTRKPEYHPLSVGVGAIVLCWFSCDPAIQEPETGLGSIVSYSNLPVFVSQVI